MPHISDFPFSHDPIRSDEYYILMEIRLKNQKEAESEQAKQKFKYPKREFDPLEEDTLWDA